MRRKGSYFISLLILVLITGPVTLGISTLLPQAASMDLQFASHDGLRAPAQASSLATYLITHYFDDAADFTVTQVVYDIGQQGGGEGVDWVVGPIDENRNTDQVIENIEEAAKESYSDWYLQGEFPRQTRCKINFGQFNFTVKQPGEGIGGGTAISYNYSAVEDELSTVSCATHSSTVDIDMEPAALSALPRETRYWLLNASMGKGMAELNERFKEDLEGKQFEAGSQPHCGKPGDAEDEAKDNAKEKAKQAVEGIGQPMCNNWPFHKQDVSCEYWAHDTDAIITQEPDAENTSELCSCNCVEEDDGGGEAMSQDVCEEDQVCDGGKEYNWEVAQDPQDEDLAVSELSETHVDLTLQDKDKEIRVDEGTVPLQLRVTNAPYNFN